MIKDKERIKEEIVNRFGLEEISPDCFYGVYHGYPLNILLESPFYRFPYVAVIVSHFEKESAGRVIGFLKPRKDSRVRYAIEPMSISAMASGRSLEDFISLMGRGIDSAIEALDEERLPSHSFCPYSGEPLLDDNSRVYTFSNGVRMRLSQKAIEDYHRFQEQYKTHYENAPNNTLTGFLGILLGALIGFGVQFGLLYMDFVGAIGPFLGVSVGVFLYQAFRGKPSYSILPLAGIVGLVSSSTAILLYFFQLAFNAFPEYQRLEAVARAFADTGYLLAFIIEVLSTLLALAVGIVLSFFRLKRMLRKPVFIIDE